MGWDNSLTEAFRVRGSLVDNHLRGDDVAEGGEERRQVGIGDVSGQVVDEQVGSRGTLGRTHMLTQRIQHVLRVDEWICSARCHCGRGGIHGSAHWIPVRVSVRVLGGRAVVGIVQ